MYSEVGWFWIIFFAALAMVVILIIANNVYGRRQTRKEKDLLEVLRHRRNNGDISDKEFDELKHDLETENKSHEHTRHSTPA